MDKLKYKLVNHPAGVIETGLSGILRTVDSEGNVDNSFIPLDNLNKDYQEYLTWVALGHEADPAD
tara:strand:- start:138 stop:332 length:195 start_codon:yes stop_codon:yes gene_type:complete